MKEGSWRRRNRSLEHVVRTTLAAIASLAIASGLSMPEAYWAAITTLIVMQSDLESTVSTSIRRLVGTALGAFLGAALWVYVGPSIPAFGAGLMLCGLVCIALGLTMTKLSGYVDRTAYRYSGITLAVVLLIPHKQGVWRIALDRFIEVSVGIVVALVFTRLWSEETLVGEIGTSVTK